MTWRSMVTYPMCLSKKTHEILDTLENLVSLPDTGDRYVDLSTWLENARKVGILTKSEVFAIRADIGPNV